MQRADLKDSAHLFTTQLNSTASTDAGVFHLDVRNSHLCNQQLNSAKSYCLHILQMMCLQFRKGRLWSQIWPAGNGSLRTPEPLNNTIIHRQHSSDSARISQFATHGHGPLRPNVTPSIKPEVHNVSQRCHRRTEPRLHWNCTKMWRSVQRFQRYAHWQTDTDRLTDWS